MKIALIHDWLDKYGGAERVITAIAEKQEFDYYYAYVNRMDAATQKKTFAGKQVHVIESIFLKLFKPIFRRLMPIFPLVVRLFNWQNSGRKVDVVISSSWVLSKGFRVGNEIHICYLQARNFKYVWDESHLYFTGIIKLLSFLKKPLQRYDIRSAQNPQYLIANSEFVQNWILEKYNRQSHVIYPPVDIEEFSISEEKEDYYIIVGRIEPYKRFDIVIRAFNENGKKLVVIGDGSQLKSLKRMAKDNIQFTGYLDRHEINKYLSRARAFVYAGVEDFGIALVEALASGTPVIAYAGGASREMIRSEYRNGIIFEEQTAESLQEALCKFEKIAGAYTPQEVRQSSLRFSKRRFHEEFFSYVDKVTGLSRG